MNGQALKKEMDTLHNKMTILEEKLENYKDLIDELFKIVRSKTNSDVFYK